MKLSDSELTNLRSKLLAYARYAFPALDSDDLVQDAFAVFYSKRRTVDPRALGKYLRQVLRNIALRRLTITKRLPMQSLGPHDCVQVDPVPCSDLELDLDRILRSFPRYYRDAAELRRLGVRICEIADKYGVTEGAIRYWLRKIARELNDD